ncbi:MAG: VWA domain-containing protein [Chlamydiota bacterium]|nr:VWA domain-containing protein [Chlamydiota bacterium]
MITAKLFYAHPEVAYLVLLLIPFFLLFLFLLLQRKKILSKLFSERLLGQIVYRRPPFNYWRKVLLLGVAWIGATFALMDPKGNARYPESIKQEKNLDQQTVKLKRKAHEVIFLIDNSASMAVKDTRTKNSRIDYAKEIVDETIRRLKGETVSYYTFTSEANKQVPSTLDYVFTRLVLRNTDINDSGVPGTDLRMAIEAMAKDYLSQSNEKLKTVILLSDGGDIAYETSADDEKNERINYIIDALGDSKKNNLRVITVGVGSREGGEIPNLDYQGEKVTSKLDPTILNELSRKGRGRYFDSNRYGTLSLAESLIDEVNRDSPYLREYEASSQVYLDKEGRDFIYDRFYHRPLGIAILCLLIVIIFPENWKREVSS